MLVSSWSFLFSKCICTFHISLIHPQPSFNQAVLAEIGANESVTKMMFLAICYSANVGGTGTLIGGSSSKFDFTFSEHIFEGTPPNLIMYDFLSDFPNNPVNKRSPR